MTNWLHHQRLAAVQAAISASGARSVLDLGCGDGDLLTRLAGDPAIGRIVGVDLCALLPSDHALVRAATVLELAGSALFACGYALGAKMLILFTLSVSLAMHPFWRSASEAAVLGDEATAGIEMIMFFKNIALVGALMFWLGMRSELSELREASKAKEKRA